MKKPSPRPGGRGEARCLAVVIVHYHAPELVERAWSALADDSRRGGFVLEGVIVDNGSTPEERNRLEGLEPRRIDAGANLGYAGGANLGLAETTAELAVLLNPDVEVLPGCLGALVAALESGAAVAGPRFYWDRPGGFLLPPTERRNRHSEILAALSGWPGFRSWARRRWRAHARRHWGARQALATPDLSGALLALRRDAWRAVPFDDGFPLYFEETDWLLRSRHAGWETVHVPEAWALHAYARSTRREPRSRGWFEESERRFRQRHYGPAFTRLLEGLGRLVRPVQIPRAGPDDEAPVALRAGEPYVPGLPDEVVGRIRWLELSPAAAGFPAAGLPCESTGSGNLDDLLVSPQLAELLEPEDRLWLRAVDAEGRTLALRAVQGT